MSWDAIIYLVQTFWVYLAIALAIGFATGWLSAAEPGA